MAFDSRTAWHSIRPPRSNLDPYDVNTDEFTALEPDVVGIRPAGEGVRAVKRRDTEYDSEPDFYAHGRNDFPGYNSVSIDLLAIRGK